MKKQELSSDSQKADARLRQSFRVSIIAIVISMMFYLAFLIKYLLTGDDYTLVCYAFITPVMLKECLFSFSLYREFHKQRYMVSAVFMGIIGLYGLWIILLALFQ